MMVVLSAVLLGAEARAAPFGWRTASPASQGLSLEKLEELRDALAERDTKGFLVIRDDTIVFEWYAPGHGRNRPHYTASMAKALVGGVAVAVALTDGRLDLDGPAARYVPRWRGHPLKSRITLRHLGSHTSGLQDAWVSGEAARGVDQGDFSGWEGEFWRWREVWWWLRCR